ncbi:hypothetical protein AC578_1578 [Pseudocercospora eumusae]|uniref:Lytic polysaccharide monooxygenase n=1 Tax=Pseudocercospora eumusae TaxID=321146 RepID=A0A139HM33_9PEZI|nr:hypothetical protein AC578_1578 [Pseudocercospora eumusae]
MFSTAFFTAAACGLFASGVNAHMVIRNPVPYGADSLTNSPLAADGSDFPCKQRSGVYDVTKMNTIAVGSPQTLSFKGSAVHGGGSCQLSITMDKQPTKSSQWKVIHSIEGGCPANATGNLPENPNGLDAATFNWQMPAGMPNGEYTLAWTWFNKIGNREMYMNCAPITVTGGSNSKDAMQALPDMFQANIGNGCTTVENEDLVFPNPGKFVQEGGSDLGSSLVGNCGAAAAPTGYSGGSGSGSGSSPASSSAAAPTGYNGGGAASSPPGYNGGGNSPVAAPKGGYGGGNGSGAAPSSVAAPSATERPGSGSGPGPGNNMSTTYDIVTVTTMATVTGAGPAPTGSDGSSSGGGSPVSYSGSQLSSGSTGTCTGGSVACDTPGSIICIGAGQFGLCDINNCAVPQALAGDTRCNANVIARRAKYLTHIKRKLKHNVRL